MISTEKNKDNICKNELDGTLEKNKNKLTKKAKQKTTK